MLAKVKKETPDERAARNAENLRYLIQHTSQLSLIIYLSSRQLKERKEKARALAKTRAPKEKAAKQPKAFQARGTGAKGR